MKKFLIIFVALMVLAVTLVSCTPTQGDTNDTTAEVVSSDVTSEEVDTTAGSDTVVDDSTVVDTTEDIVTDTEAVVNTETVTD